MVHSKGRNINQARQKLCMVNVGLLTEVRHEKSVVAGHRDRLYGRDTKTWPNEGKEGEG